VICEACGNTIEEEICVTCVRKIAGAVDERRDAIINSAMHSLDEEADKVFDQDPTRGRGRGPKWMDINTSDT
jgi:hypothetical protein